jgi:hypothetical protein
MLWVWIGLPREEKSCVSTDIPAIETMAMRMVMEKIDLAIHHAFNPCLPLNATIHSITPAYVKLSLYKCAARSDIAKS